MVPAQFDEKALRELGLPLDPGRVEALPSGHRAAGKPYLAGEDVIRRANEIFGFGGWTFQLVTPPYVLSPGDVEGKGEIWASVGRVTAGGVSYEDMGMNIRSGKGPAALEMSAKGSITDAVKRCLTYFGDQFGLVLRDKETTPEGLRTAWTEATGELTGGAPSHVTLPREVTTLAAQEVIRLLGQRGERPVVLAEIVPVAPGALTVSKVAEWMQKEQLGPGAVIARLDAQRKVRAEATTEVAEAFPPEEDRPAQTNHDLCVARMGELNLGAQAVANYMHRQFNAKNVDAWCEEKGRSGVDLADLAHEARRSAAPLVTGVPR